MGIDAGHCLFVSFQYGDYLLAWNINYFNGSIITSGEKLAVIIEEGELSDEFVVRFECGYFIFGSCNINNEEVAIVIAGSDEMTLIGPGERSEEDLAYFYLLCLLFGSQIIEINPS